MNYEKMWDLVRGPLMDGLWSAMKEQVTKGKGIPCSYHVFYPSGKTTDIYVDDLLNKKEWKDQGLNKVKLMEIIRYYLKDTQPDFVVFISEGFTLHIEVKDMSEKEREEMENDIMQKYGSIEKTPGRGEIIICNATTKYGVQHCKTAQVIRDGENVRFEDIGSTDNWGGRMIMERWARD